MSPKSLNSDANQLLDKKIQSHYYMAPGELDELVKIGGVPRDVLAFPTAILSQNPNDLDTAEKKAYSHVKKAIEDVNDATFLRLIAQAKDSSGHLLHCWPKDDII
ncbi:2378_t:CDS:1 [Paraglomus occultum]|uniref:2378_t:CDS:1 n=1 Tax=Paraglomus occultum TaxID=144539 RepID=A0A9N8VLE0_9GLOM|nr:2378_t:CDS:1 [Paraglomus occultum]